jgi:hypothetical protein
MLHFSDFKRGNALGETPQRLRSPVERSSVHVACARRRRSLQICSIIAANNLRYQHPDGRRGDLIQIVRIVVSCIERMTPRRMTVERIASSRVFV